MTININRRGFILGAASLLAAPAIVRVDSLMKIAMPKRVLTHAELAKIWLDAMDKMIRPSLFMAEDLLVYGSTFTRITAGDIERVDPMLIKWGPEAERLTDWSAPIVAEDWTSKTIKAPPDGFQFEPPVRA